MNLIRANGTAPFPATTSSSGSLSRQDRHETQNTVIRPLTDARKSGVMGGDSAILALRGGGHCRDRTYDIRDVNTALYR